MFTACANGPQVVVHTQHGDVAVAVELATTPETRQYGLMYRKDLSSDSGMLFIFPQDQVQTFWMKNTPLPLDMIFIDSNKTIAGIAADAKPFTTTPRSVDKPSRYVLEVHGGYCAKHSIQAGDRVEFRNISESGVH